MGVDQLVTGGDFDDPVVESLTAGSVNTADIENDPTGTKYKPQVLEDFEKNDLSYYEGNTDDISIKSSDIEGDFLLQMVDLGVVNPFYSTDIRLPRGYKYRIYLRENGGDPIINVGVGNENSPSDDHYSFEVSPSRDEITILKREAGSRTDLATASPSLTVGDIYILEFEYGLDGHLGMRLMNPDLSVVSGSEITASDKSIDADVLLAYHGGGSGSNDLDYLSGVPL